MGGYDLYGNYYPRQLDAMNAEMAQCSEISNGLQVNENRQMWEEIARLHERIRSLEEIAKPKEE